MKLMRRRRTVFHCDGTDYGRLGDKDQAFLWLNRCYEEGAGMNFVKFDPAFDNVRSDSRFADLLRRMGFPN